MQTKRNAVFISHASEDKESFVRPLAHALKNLGLQVWYDEFSLKLGDSLRRSIDRGLSECAAGIVVLSPSFFGKEWPQRELDALYAAEVAGRSRILPIWHELDAAYIARISPLLADRRAALSSNGVDQVSREIANEFPASAVYTSKELASILERFPTGGPLEAKALSAGCRYRFLLLNALKQDICEFSDSVFDELTEEQLEELPPEAEARIAQEHSRLRRKYGIPESAYLTLDEPVHEERLGSFLKAIDGWVRGSLSPEDSATLVADLDLAELDEYFVLLGLPNFSFSSEQRDLLERSLVSLGFAAKDGYKEVFRLCDELRRLDDKD